MPTKEWWLKLVAKLRGHYQYYGVSGNMPALWRYYAVVFRLARKWLNRRSQCGKFWWKQFMEYVKQCNTSQIEREKKLGIQSIP